ncbi:MAG: circadian clock KaiB family protein [Leptolyngbyaceae cyanobacterium bins.59]|nr:circadian clock KaiB family protein [Leptolyngbyaceae cyanobacterium bins.59]
MTPAPLPQLFKGIALFTPGGDLVYCIDQTKQNRWHLQLCLTLKEVLGLLEPPHFLVPCYTATIDRWQHSRTGKLEVAAELYPLVRRHRTLLSAIFQTSDQTWKEVSTPEEACDPIVLNTYRHQFPALWKNHDLVLRVESQGTSLAPKWNVSIDRPAVSSLARLEPSVPLSVPSVSFPANEGYVLRLFVSGHSAATERTLKQLHALLEQYLPSLYTLKVIDVLKHPEQAEADQISATPTLMRVWPQPVRRIVGELNDMNQVLQLLGTQPGGLGTEV